MGREAGWKVIQAAFRCGADLQTLLRFLKENYPPDEYRQYASGFAAAIDAINVQLIERTLNLHPELREKIETDLEKFGHVT